MTRRPVLFLLVLTAGLAACGGDVPERPTWFRDVQPILRANCVRCHGADPVDPGLAGYRLDRYVLAAPAIDAADYVDAIVQHAVDHEVPAMPPDYALTDRQQAILVNWSRLSAAERKPVDASGAPTDRGNRPGSIELLQPEDVSTPFDQSLDLTYRAWDDDLDGLIVELFARDLDTDVRWPLGKPTGGGMRTLAADAGTLPSRHEFEVYAIVDDGYTDDVATNRLNTRVLIPSLQIDHGARGTAPSVTLLTPDGGDLQLGTIAITWVATDPDTDASGNPDVLAIDLALVPYPGGVAGTPIAIASGLPNHGAFTWTIPSAVPARDATNVPIPYRVRVTATDSLGVPNNVRSDESDLTFLVEQTVVTNLRWADVKPVFVQSCGTTRCHDRDGVARRPDFCAPQYEQGEDPNACDPATDKGVFEYRSLVLSQITTGTMPPAASPQPSTMQRDMVIEWLRGGAPYGSGPTDATPTFTWTAPGTTTLVASGGAVTLQWTVADAEGLASDEVQYARVPGTGPLCSLGASTCGNYAIVDTAWQPVTSGAVSGTSQARTTVWTTPVEGAGCYCVRGAATDTAAQSSGPVRATRPVKF